ncbi:MAG: TetR/AcrR family transcriptional regulator [Sciscionella sp.]
MTGTRERIMETTAELFRRQGYQGTGLKQISRESSATFGSLYHFFPGGKEQLGVEVVRCSGRGFQDLGIAIFGAASDVIAATRELFSGAAEVLRGTSYADACPIATVALEVASTSEPLREATAEVFDSWISALCSVFERVGIPVATSRALALQALSALEGAFVLCRARRSTDALDAAAELMVQAVRAALQDTGGSG